MNESQCQAAEVPKISIDETKRRISQLSGLKQGSFRKQRGPTILQRRLKSNSETLGSNSDPATPFSQVEKAGEDVNSARLSLNLSRKSNMSVYDELSPKSALIKGHYDIRIQARVPHTPAPVCSSMKLNVNQSESADSVEVESQSRLQLTPSPQLRKRSNFSDHNDGGALVEIEHSITSFLESENVRNVALHDYLKALGVYEEKKSYLKQLSFKTSKRKKSSDKVIANNKTITPSDPVKTQLFQGLQCKLKLASSTNVGGDIKYSSKGQSYALKEGADLLGPSSETTMPDTNQSGQTGLQVRTDRPVMQSRDDEGIQLRVKP